MAVSGDTVAKAIAKALNDARLEGDPRKLVQITGVRMVRGDAWEVYFHVTATDEPADPDDSDLVLITVQVT